MHKSSFGIRKIPFENRKFSIQIRKISFIFNNRKLSFEILTFQFEFENLQLK